MKRYSILDMNSLKIINVGTPVDNGDAVNKLFVTGGYQPLDATLTALAGLDSSTGILGQTAADTFTKYTFDTDGTLAANSDTRVATQKAVKTYADQLIAASSAMVFKGAIDCSGNPNYPAATLGWTYVVSVAGKIGGASGKTVEAGDLILCLETNAGGDEATVGTKFDVVQVNLVGAVTGPASSTNNNIAVFDGVTGKVIKDGGAAIASLVPTSRTVNGHALSADVTVTKGDVGLTNVTDDAQVKLSTVTTLNDFIVATGNAAVTRKTPSEVKTILDVSKVADSTTNGNILVDGSEVVVYAHPTDGYAANVGNGSDSDIVVTHSLNSRDVIVQVYDASSYAEIGCDVARTTVDTVTLSFATAPTSNQFRVVIQKIH